MSNDTSKVSFLVIGNINGDSIAVRADSPVQAEWFAQSFAKMEPNAQASWMVQVKGELPEQPSFFARLQQGLTGDARRVTHTFIVAPNMLLEITLEAVCGARFTRNELEFLPFHRSANACLACWTRVMPGWINTVERPEQPLSVSPSLTESAPVIESGPQSSQPTDDDPDEQPTER
ncbi:hypothetical protein [Sciscionella sediminilitoris]|uniref:hypothetical protein n=1 Tax=Sciscionella sediminilitoris TaxID=1445613 RepID=UPI0012E1251C|nr:hypothetical protein [Sciscionella sp. SE31]